MEFFDQPRDVIINEELVNLPIADLLNACQVNPLFDQLCKDPDLWRARIRHDYPEVDQRVIKNPREFYLKQALFGGQIYIHRVIYSGGLTDYSDTTWLDIIPEAETLMVTPTVVPYDDLFAYAREIAEQNKPADKEYFIVYSRPTAKVHRPELTQIAYQSKDHIELLPGPAQKITLVNIMYLLPDSKYLLNLDPLKEIKGFVDRGQPAMVNQVFYSVDDLELTVSNMLSTTNFGLNNTLMNYHANANTLFYQSESKHVTAQLRAKAIIPKFPGLSDVDHSGDIAERKRELLQFVTGLLVFADFLHGRDNVLGFKSSEEFAAFQRDYINNMSEDQLKMAEALRKLVTPRTYIADYVPDLSKIQDPVLRFAFDVRGQIVFFD